MMPARAMEDRSGLRTILEALELPEGIDLDGSLMIVPPHLLAVISINCAQNYLSSLGQGVPSAEDLAYAQRFTRHLYGHRIKGKNVVFPLHRMANGATDTGALGIAIDPNKTYPISGHNYYVLKDTNDRQAAQALKDSLELQDDSDFQLENIVASVPMGTGRTFLWKQFLIGPDLSQVFSALDDGLERTKSQTEKRAMSNLEAAISEEAAKRLFYWQQNSPDLIAQDGDYRKVADSYIANICNALNDFKKFTNAPITDGDIGAFGASARKWDWNFINAQTTVRNLGATYRNWVLQTGKINMGYDDLLDRYMEPTPKGPRVKTEQLFRDLYFVDTPSKLSHILEDPWEMDLSLEGRQKEPAVISITAKYLDLSPKVRFSYREKELMHAYRAFRRAQLVLTKHWDRNDEMLQREDITSEEHQRNRESYHESMRYLIGEGQNASTRLYRYHPEKISGIFTRLGQYTSIRGQFPSSS